MTWPFNQPMYICTYPPLMSVYRLAATGQRDCGELLLVVFLERGAERLEGTVSRYRVDGYGGASSGTSRWCWYGEVVPLVTFDN